MGKESKKRMNKKVSRKSIKNKTRVSGNNNKNVKNLRRMKKYKKGGFRVSMPSEYFGNKTGHYENSPIINPGARSQGSLTGDKLQTLANLKPSCPQKGGAVLPIEFFGGNSGRYFEAGAPELSQCSNAYGRHIANSHGVVMDPPHNQWMAPNLAANPEFRDLTGGGKRKRSYKKKSKNSKKSGKMTKKVKKNTNNTNNKRMNKNKKNTNTNNNKRMNKNRKNNNTNKNNNKKRMNKKNKSNNRK